MTIRDGLSNLVRRLRGMTQVGTADYSLIIGDGSTVFWWSNDHLYEKLDLYACDYYFASMQARQETSPGGTARYYDYSLPAGNVEEATSGTVYWRVADSTGSVVGTAEYATDYVAGIVRFNADRGGTAYYWRGRSYNLNRAAADIWRDKAANAAKYFNFTSDNQRFEKSQFYEHCVKMATYYDKEAGVIVGRFQRTDLLPKGSVY